jgi:hypothetical protein
MHATKLSIFIPESHRLELTVPAELPSGPAQITIVSTVAPGPRARARAMGMDAGLGWIADDFDAPLPESVQRSFEDDE